MWARETVTPGKRRQLHGFTCLVTRDSDCCFRSVTAAWYPLGFPTCSMCHRPVLIMIISGCWSPPALHEQCMRFLAPVDLVLSDHLYDATAGMPSVLLAGAMAKLGSSRTDYRVPVGGLSSMTGTLGSTCTSLHA